MFQKRFLSFVCSIITASLLITACNSVPASTQANAPTNAVTTSEQVSQPTTPASTELPVKTTNYQIPAIEEGKFNAVGVLFSPHDDGGWGQAAYEGLVYMGEHVPGLHMAYVESVPEGTESEQVFRSLARKGFDLIIGVSFGYMDPMQTVAEEFPKTMFVHIAGYKSNNTNFGNLFGAEEDMYYLAAMLAGARAKMDGNPQLGVILSFPIPEEIRFANAIALGMKVTCPECTLDLRWINTWHNPVDEKEAAASLLDAGAQVIFNTDDTPAPSEVTEEKGKGWAVNAYFGGSCKKYQRCLTTAYFNWGPIFADIAQKTMSGQYKPGFQYFNADSGGLGLYGFMEDQTLTPGVAELPTDVIQTVREKVQQLLDGKLDRTKIWCGPINDNTGNMIVPAGSCLSYNDFDQFPPGATGLECKYCMHWFADGIKAVLPPIQ
jgi:basic membrane protein A